ncbi:MAG: lytic transglycosylase domain-containing protein, partial [Siculibacillus sp.]
MQVDGKTTVEKRIAGAFKAAGEATGTSFRYLLSTSARESSHRADLAAETSSAKGLFQFVDQTWFDLIRREGPSVGLERLAEKITPDGKGGWTVAGARDRARILSLKTDPLVASVMAGKLTAENTSRLTDTLGRGPTDGELYAAHVLGAAGATKLIRSASSEPNTAAAVVFPRAAAANAALFYDRGGRARTVAELHATLTRSPDPAADPTSTRIAEAHAALA